MKIEILFKEFCNLYGDIGNINYLEKTVEYFNDEYGIKSEIIYTGINDKVQFIDEKNNIDLVYIGAFSETKFDIILNKFESIKGELVNSINRGQLIIATANVIDLLSSFVVLDKRYIDKNFITTNTNLTTLEYLNLLNDNENTEELEKDLNKDINKEKNSILNKIKSLLKKNNLTHEVFNISDIKNSDINKEKLVNTYVKSVNKVKNEDKEEKNSKSNSNSIYFKKGLGLFNTFAVTNMLLRYNSSILADFEMNNTNENIKMVGFKNSFTQTYYVSNELLQKNKLKVVYDIKDNKENYCFKVKRGSGNSKYDKFDGIKINNLFVTQIVGPLFILNPDFTKYILNLIVNENNEENNKEVLPYLYNELKDAYNVRLKEFKDPKKDLGEFIKGK